MKVNYEYGSLYPVLSWTMRYSASVQIKLKVQFACARRSVDQSEKEEATRKELPQFECDVALFPLAITGCCLNILSLHDLEIGTVKTNANVQRCPLKLK